MPSPQKARATRPRGSEEEFVLFLQGIPAHCRWQELKDLVRQTALHIRQAVVYDDNRGFPTGLGQIIVKNEDEAWRTYHRLSTHGWEGQSLVVTLARTSSPTRPIAGPTKSPTCMNYVAGYSTPPRVTTSLAVPTSPLSPEPTYQGPEYTAPMMSPMAVPLQPFLPIFTDPLCQPIPAMSHSPGLRPSFCDPNLAFAFFPAYPISPMAHPLHDTTINTMHMDSSSSATTNNSHPHHRPRKSISSYTRPMTRRTIFIQNLSASTTPTDLETFLQQSIGTNVTTSSIEQTEMPLDAETGCCKGFARVTFHQTEEAKRAVTMCNNAIFMGAKIRVKIDRSIHVRYSLAQGPTSLPESSPGIVAPESSGAEMKLSAAGARRESAPTQVDRCQPLVVNGSGIGRRVVAT